MKQASATRRITLRWLAAATEEYEGSRIAFYFLIIVAVVGTGRSLVHIFAADGGAHSIAGPAVDVEGGANFVAIFAQWGASQLILAILYGLAILRYRFLTPFMLAMVVVEQLLRLGTGQLKPLEVAAAPPGATGSYILPPLDLPAFILSLRGRSKSAW